MTSRDTTLRFRPIAAGVVRTAQRHAWRILAVSIVVSAVTVAAEIAADHLLDRTDLTAALAGSLSTSTVSLLGAVFLSGFLGRLVSNTGPGQAGLGEAAPEEAGHEKSGHEARGTRLRDVLRSLPWGSLILPDPSGPADVVTTLIVRSVGQGIVDSAVGLLLVELCYRLIAADHAAARPAARPTGATRSLPPGPAAPDDGAR